MRQVSKEIQNTDKVVLECNVCGTRRPPMPIMPAAAQMSPQAGIHGPDYWSSGNSEPSPFPRNSPAYESASTGLGTGVSGAHTRCTSRPKSRGMLSLNSR